MVEIRLVGAGMVPFGRDLHRSDRAMAEQAAESALKDAGLTAEDVERIFFGNAAGGLMTGQEMIRGQVALQHTQLRGIPLVNVENACASSSSAANLAVEALQARRCEVALVLGVEKLSHEQKTRAFDALRGASDVNAGQEDDGAEATNSVFIDVYAAEGRAYMVEFGARVEDFAAVAVKNRHHASLNPLAQYRQPQTLEDVMSARPVVDPLTLPMCSPTTDGAAALVLCTADYARRAGLGGCRIRATRLVAGAGRGSEPVAVAAQAAFDDAGVGPDDLDVLEVHDAAAPAEILQYAEIGLCGRGEGHLLVREGATALGGRIPVNVSGGLMSRGHPIGATGAAQLVEIYTHLVGRGGDRQVDGARIGMAVNAGGWLNGAYGAAVATIMERC
jgi:acetyl-CoA acetyltransferase